MNLTDIKRNSSFSCRNCGGNFIYQKPEPHTSEFCSKICWHLHHNKLEETKQEITSCLLCGRGGIIVCEQCKSMDETFWDIVSSALMSKSEVVKKQWGFEVHIVNHKDYCLKYLVFFSGCHFSFHRHLVKKELWHCVVGEFYMMLEDNSKITLSKLNKGDKIEIQPGVIHQLKAIKNSILVEVSTQSFDEDSYRDEDIIPS